MTFPYPSPLLISVSTSDSANNTGPISFVGSGGVAVASSVTYNFSSLLDSSNATPTILAGDLVMCTIANGNDSTQNLVPADYTLAASNHVGSSGGAQINFQVGYKFMGATPDTSISVSIGGGFQRGILFIHVFRGVDKFNPFDGAATTSSGDADPPSFTPVTSGAWVLAFAAQSEAATNLSPNFFSNPTGFDTTTNLFQTGWDNGTVDTMVAVAAKSGWTSGAVDPGSMGGSSVFSNSGTMTTALRPAP